MTRFNMDATTLADASQYLRERSLQLLANNYHAVGPVEPLLDGPTEWGCRQLFHCSMPGLSSREATHQSVYLYAQHRGQRRMQRYLRENTLPVVTVPGCKIDHFLARHALPHTIAGWHTEWDEYLAVSTFYGDGCAKRSKVPFMHHVDEGLAVMRWHGAGDMEMRAFCLHPLVQADRDLATNFLALESATRDPRVMALAVEYRATANATLSHREISEPQDIPLSVLRQVSRMLVGDKVQNYKDFLLHHSQTHPRRRDLDRYFRLWLERLGVSPAQFASWFAALQGPEPLPIPEVP